MTHDAGGLSESLFARMIAMGIEPYMLEIQYRMHPIISEFPSVHFYGGKIKDGIVAAQRPSPTGIAWPSEGNPIAFVNVDGYEKQRYACVCRFVGRVVSCVECAYTELLCAF
jgi:regulator of nonsense transcripts 1